MQTTPLEELVRALSNYFSSEGSVSSAQASAALLRYIETGHPKLALEQKIAEFVADPTNELPTVDSARMVLHLGEQFSILLALQAPQSIHLYSQPFRGFVTPIAGAGMELDRYVLPAGWVPEVYTPTTALVFDQTQSVQKGSVAFFDGRHELVEVRATGPNTVSIRVFEHPRTSLEWAFSRDTLLPVGVVASDPVASRRQYIVRTLGEMGCISSVAPLQQMLSDNAHFVRWSAVQALGKCDRDAAIAGLSALAEDAHPQVRAAAQRALYSAKSE